MDTGNMITNEPHGLKTANSVGEKTWVVATDIVTYGASTLMDDQPFFSQNILRNKVYRNYTWDGNITWQKNITFTHCYMTYNIQLLLQETSSVFEVTMQYFEEFSRLIFENQERRYDPLPIAMFLNHNIVATQNAAATQTTTFVPFRNRYVELPEPILLPRTGGLGLTFSPAPGLTTVAAAATNPHLWNPTGATAADARINWIKIELGGWQERPNA